MDIGQYISDLLKEHQEVSLPGIGTFFKRMVNASFDAHEYLYYPPSYTIDLKEGDSLSSLLINHIVSTKHISESSAIYFIERFSENLKSNLEKESNTPILPIGTLTKVGDSIVLEAAPLDFNPDFFGLNPVSELNPRTSPLVDEGVNIFSNEENVRPGRTWIWISASLILLASIIGLAWFYYPQYFKSFTSNKQNNENLTAVAVPDSARNSVSFADSIVNQLEKQGLHGSEVEKAPDTVKISSNTSSPDGLIVKPKASIVYEIIIGSFALASEAEVSVKTLRNKGIDAKLVVDIKKPKFKVSLGTFTNLAAANKEKKRIQQDINKDAWILTVNNKEN